MRTAEEIPTTENQFECCAGMRTGSEYKRDHQQTHTENGMRIQIHHKQG